MRWLPRAIPILIGIIALDFALVFALDSVRVLTSSAAGLDQPTFARVVYNLGSLVRLGPDGIVMLAMFFGAIYAAIAGLCSLHLASRLYALRGGRVSHESLDAALILVVMATLAAATPAMLHGASDFLIQQRLPMWMVGLAATLSMIERLPESENSEPAGFWERKLLAMIHRRSQAASLLPAQREGVSATRWDALRREAGMNEPAELKNGGGPYAIR